MVVADEDPPRKRSRLSLKSSRKGENAPSPDEPPTLESAGATPQGPAVKPESEPIAEDCPPPLLDLSQSDLPSDSVGVPPVASLENLGNTCFLNSVLEVLRYTPCFLEGLGEIYRHIVYIEKVKATAAERHVPEVKTEPVLSWELVKNLFKMYKRMEKREQMFFQFANADVTSMAIKPDKILDSIREFNPMFEGNMQHDAQELLRCLLCYLEDSEKELHTDYARIWAVDPALLKTPIKEEPAGAETEKQLRNSIMEKFLASAKGKPQRRIFAAAETQTQCGDSGDSLSADPSVTSTPGGSAGCHGNGADKGSGGTVVNGGDMLDKPDAETGEGKRMKSPRPGPRSKKRKFQSVVAKQLATAVESAGQDEVDGCVKSSTTMETSLAGGCRLLEQGSSEDSSKQEEEYLGKRTRKSTRNRAVGNSPDGCDRQSESPKCGGLRTSSRRNMSQANCNASGDGKYSEDKISVSKTDSACLSNSEDKMSGSKTDSACLSNSVDKNQPTILSMFSKRGLQCRRLGMRGHVVCRDQNGGASVVGELSEPQEADTNPVRASPDTARTSTLTSTLVSPKKRGCHASNGSVKSGETEPPSVSGSVAMDTPPSGAKVASNSQAVRKSPRKLTGSSASQHCLDMNGVAACSLLGDGGDQINTAGVSSPVNPHYSRAHPSQNLPEEMLPFTPPPSPAAPLTKGGKTLVSSARDSRDYPSPAKENKTPTRSLTRVSLGKGADMNIMQPKLMIKLEKCDHLFNSPTVSASAAMKALQPHSSAICKVTFSSEEAENEHDSDNEEEEGSLGMKASFQSVPLKSVSVKVEKCDMVCSSPEKSVSARFATTCLARQRAQRFNMIEKLFQGSMMMRTKCLECENCTERRESFQDVSVPLKEKGSTSSDSESDEDHNTCLLSLMQAFTEVEQLQDDNKYFCDHCLRKNEAERSLHYDMLPNILTVHLKRFSATTGMFGCLSKINDHVTVPLLLSCLRYKCPKPCVRADHRYTLFAIITHAGSTIMSGHYLAYIKVRPNADGSPLGYDTLATYLNNSPKKRSQSTSGHTDGETQCVDLDLQTQCGTSADLVAPPISSSGESARDSCGSRSQEKGTKREVGGDTEADSDPNASNYHWLECDDETICILTQKEFQARLSEKEGALRGTPYVLFYHRLDTWKGK